MEKKMDPSAHLPNWHGSCDRPRLHSCGAPSLLTRSGPSDFFFRQIEEELRGRKFQSRAAVGSALCQCLKRWPQERFAEGIHSLPGRWKKCIEAEGITSKGKYNFYCYFEKSNIDRKIPENYWMPIVCIAYWSIAYGVWLYIDWCFLLAVVQITT